MSTPASEPEAPTGHFEDGTPYVETTWGELRTGDEVVPWSGETNVCGTWTVISEPEKVIGQSYGHAGNVYSGHVQMNVLQSRAKRPSLLQGERAGSVRRRPRRGQ